MESHVSLKQGTWSCPLLQSNHGACNVTIPEITRLLSVPATNMVCELTMYGAKLSVEVGEVFSFSESALCVPLLVVPSPPIVRPLPETTIFVNTPCLELNSLKSTAPVTLLELAVLSVMWPT